MNLWCHRRNKRTCTLIRMLAVIRVKLIKQEKTTRKWVTKFYFQKDKDSSNGGYG